MDIFEVLVIPDLMFPIERGCQMVCARLRRCDGEDGDFKASSQRRVKWFLIAFQRIG